MKHRCDFNQQTSISKILRKRRRFELPATVTDKDMLEAQLNIIAVQDVNYSTQGSDEVQYSLALAEQYERIPLKLYNRNELSQKIPGYGKKKENTELELRRSIHGALVLDTTTHLTRQFTLCSLCTPQEEFPPFPIFLKENVNNTDDYSTIIVEATQIAEELEIITDFVAADGNKAKQSAMNNNDDDRTKNKLRIAILNSSFKGQPIHLVRGNQSINELQMSSSC
ncbi:MAG: hypothetical protein EZS28_006504 [Streblomastix strix]|uniref:Uncharacterized protein n=1 Tax=Streblomastix strix TaxID=222440 RepID=A0A5J4WTT2_9EUKA|nr:MAG: hypothetical protein EZS28_006504 [Streblomastix strix]